ncbi:hypothetical protein BHU72_04730 [Desulfuribacillus stibiiarsenatis]|uniref:Diguanylate cyclase response regulator n=1 Tax=Desulfuribacillus stibiiarsenatis TaxID=1390249 RepID=A0A1E5L5U0_9FIRM|nr:diguanylate cyclase [Desulfuribacillus stibiiarsenatis]OEH85398.1 hypothetical protein BHU72_04730 [Desulfuribacillus stibiiarsenatis]
MRKTKILIIDDCLDTQRLLKKYISDYLDAEVVAAVSADQGISVLTDDVDLILLDILMPEKDGICACREIKSKEAFRDIPIVIVTQYDNQEIFRDAFIAGASDFIKKPFNKIELCARVGSLLQLSAEMKKRKVREKELQELNAQLQDRNETLKKLSMIDGLTGIANRRYLEEYLEREWRYAVRNKGQLSLVMFDIDYFKLYNDYYGHQCGDDTLKAIAQTVEKILKRPTDMVARYGGEEFVVILPATAIHGAMEIAKQIRGCVEGLQICHEKSAISDYVTISLGVTTIHNYTSDSTTTLIEHADNALYKAKNSGRNKVVQYEEVIENCSFINNTCRLS